MPKRKKKKLTKKQENTLKHMKERRQIDSNNLRQIITAKLKYAYAEKEKALKYIANTNIQIERLNGIILFCKDLIEPIKKEEKK